MPVFEVGHPRLVDLAVNQFRAHCPSGPDLVMDNAVAPDVAASLDGFGAPLLYVRRQSAGTWPATELGITQWHSVTIS